MGYDFDSVKRSLQISENQFHELDALDGKKDGQISRSVFEIAMKYRHNMLCPKEEFVYRKSEKSLYDNVKAILNKSFTSWEVPKSGEKWKVGELSGSPNHEEHPDISDGNNVHYNDSVAAFDFQGNVCKKYAEHVLDTVRTGNKEAFVFEGLPMDVDITNFSHEYIYDDGSNDTQVWKYNRSNVTRKPDAIKVSMTFNSKGEECVTVKTFRIEELGCRGISKK